MASSVKLYSLAILFFMSIVSGLVIPYLILQVFSKKCQNSNVFKKVLGLLNCFTGGVFLATTFVTLLPEARETAEKAFQMMDTQIEYPITEVIVGLGFLLILIIEGVTVFCYRKCKKESSYAMELEFGGSMDGQVKGSATSETTGHTCSDEFCISYQNGHATVVPVVIDMGKSTEIRDEPSTQGNDTLQSISCLKDGIDSQGMSGLHSIVLLLALSIHMVFEGISLGLLDDDNEVWEVLLALGIHKVLIFLSTGMTVFERTTTKKFIIAMCYLSAVSPLGVGIGILLTSQSGNVGLTTASAFLQAVSVGNFLYVAIFEILLKEFAPSEKGRIFKTISTFIGYSLLAMIKYVI